MYSSDASTRPSGSPSTLPQSESTAISNRDKDGHNNRQDDASQHGDAAMKGLDSDDDLQDDAIMDEPEEDDEYKNDVGAEHLSDSDVYGRGRKRRKPSAIPASSLKKGALRTAKGRVAGTQRNRARKPATPKKRNALPTPDPTPIKSQNIEEDDQDALASEAIADEEDQDLQYTSGAVYKDVYKCRSGIALDKPPLATISEMFVNMTKEARKLGLDDALKAMDNRPLRVATMCSGTESPILAGNMIKQSLESDASEFLLHFYHAFSAEIVPHKQDYIQRNFAPPVIFRDITELARMIASRELQATTAHGGKVDIPRDIDLLIAGFCCVDFSNLNNNKKSLEDLGESGDTFFAMLAYANEARPKVMILENVLGAPWEDKKGKGKKSNKKSIATRLSDIGYSCVFIKADTKEFYIPHTRQRGYMICVDNCLPDTSTAVNALLEGAKNIFNKLKYPASIPVESMILRDGDPLLRENANETTAAVRERVKWDKCQAGHEDYRQQLGLGNQRPVTYWSPDGSNINPDYFVPFLGQKERVSDTVDIAHLRNILRGFDDRYYSRNLELSQNCYRVTDVTKLGIIGCLTPTGMPFNTYSGRMITGSECMTLQGLPLEQLDLGTLTQAQLRDLAGNAMSSTVVGATIFATLITFYNIFKFEGREKVFEKVLVPELVGEEKLQSNTSNPTAYIHTTVDSLLRLAMRTNRRCYCEGRHDRHDTQFRQCKVCKHTACIEHSRNPKHEYQLMGSSFIQNRQSPAKFEETVKKSLPAKISFGGSFDTKGYLETFREAYKQDRQTKEQAIQCIEAALHSKVHFAGVKRSEQWEIQFNSETAKLVLIISSSLGIQWLLFAKVPAHFAGDHPVRTLLEKFPVARMRPSGDLIHEGPWSFWVPESCEFQATITSSGSLEESFQADRALESYVDSRVYNTCSIAIQDYDKKYFEVDIRGDYQRSRYCAQAFDSLHAKIENQDQLTFSPIFFYFDHERQTGDPAEHSFIFTRDTRRQPHGEYRPIIARVISPWRQPMVWPDSQVEDKKIDPTTVIVDGYWLGSDGFCFTFDHDHQVIYHRLPKDVSDLQLIGCNSQQAVFTCEYTVDRRNISFPTDKWIEVDRANEFKFFSDYGWIIEKCKVLDGHLLNNLKEVDEWHLTDQGNGHRCTDCAPTYPTLRWAFEKKKKGNKLPRQIPYEDPKEATGFEQGLKLRPPPVKMMFRIGLDGKFHLSIGFNPMTLCHRGFSLLKSGDNSHSVVTSWWLATDYVKSLTEGLAAFKLQNTQNERLAFQAPGFPEQHRLRPEQLQKLSWMEAQEGGVAFTEREFVEYKMPQLEYLLVGQAKRNRFVRGGILADDVGFGKTILILAIILSRRKVDEEFADKPAPGLIPTKATIIFVPAQLPKQWREEAEKFMGNTYRRDILLIERIQDLQELSVEDIKKALVIIVNCNLCESDKYQMALAHLAGMVEPAKKATSRAKATWHKAVVERLTSNVNELIINPGGFQSLLHSQFEESIAIARSKDLPIPSKRVTGAEYQKINRKRKFDDMKEDGDDQCEKLEPRPDNHNFRNLGRRGYEALTFPVFEMFKFARIVVDEFTYIDSSHSITMMNLFANVYWALSGTPPLEEFLDVKHMAEFLRVNLGVHDYSNMKRDVYARVTSEMTASEKLLTYQGMPSKSWLKLRHDHAARFLDTFVRKDFPIIKEIPSFQFVNLLRLTPQQNAVYSELEQRVVAKKFELKAVSSDDDMERYINEALTGTNSGREALLFRASYSSILGAPHAKPKDAWEAFVTVLTLRHDQLHVTLEEWSRSMRSAVRLQNHPANKGSGALEDFLHRVYNNQYGDLEAAAKLRGVADIEKRDYRPENDNKFQYSIENPSAALRKVRLELGKYAQQLVDRMRQHRFLKSIERIHDDDQAGCDCCRDIYLKSKPLIVLSSCGHLICKASYSQRQEGKCPVDGCNTFYQHHQMVPQPSFVPSTIHSSKGEKLHQIAHFINNEVPDDDQVLIFVQSSQLREKLLGALNDHGITYTDLKSTGLLSNKLTKFQHSRGKRDKALILAIGDASASGSNLTMANYIIFVAPYFTSGSNAQQLYDAARTQAIGRVRRFGQKKAVQVHDFVTNHTIDVDILEKRNQKLLKVSGKVGSGSDPANHITTVDFFDAETDEKSKFGSRIARLIFPDGDGN